MSVRRKRRTRRRVLRPKRLTLKLRKGLSRRAAFLAVLRKKPRGRDFRGFKYNARTGKAVIV